ncbi:DUF2637 domain-containing protein [Streptomyces pseudovenezuelae]|uniref:DUF2637 domain-containing protein n=1 Tax=Streptomyces pseudovenezuelae TaxID=67350 RepID=UPI00247473F1|nr:DUF2637 domain-containing protein [Streptomyces pseudovenezuelae]
MDKTAHDESVDLRQVSSASVDGASGLEVWVRRCCALVVASVAAYASYVHQREFALQGGADGVSATLWPLSVDGLLLLATVGLLNSARGAGRRARTVVWLAFLLGIAVSLAANVAAAPALEWKPVLVAGWPPVALLLSVELLAHRLGGREGVESAGGPSTTAAETRYESGPNPDRDESEDTRRDEDAADRDETATDRREVSERGREPSDGGESEEAHALLPEGGRSRSVEVTAEEVMWEHFQGQLAAGHASSGAELDRVAGTNNYGRAVLPRWRRTGRIPETVDAMRVNGSGGHS